MYSRVVTPPATEPVALADAKVHLRVQHADEDALIGGLVAAAREYVEQYTRRSLMPQVRELVLDGWHGRYPIRLPYAPIRGVVSVTYTDTLGTPVVMPAADYLVDVDAEPGRLFPAYSTHWPTVRTVAGAIRIRYAAGYADTTATPAEAAAAVPAGMKQAILLLVGHWYENRESVVIGTIAQDVPMTVTMLLSPHRLLEFQ